MYKATVCYISTTKSVFIIFSFVFNFDVCFHIVLC